MVSETMDAADAVIEEQIATNKVIDAITGTPVQATPEEVEAVQPFLRQLLDDYGYPKERIRSRPQWHVKARPSDRKKLYPVDIAIFSSDAHTDDDLFIVVECKKKNRKDGRGQLEDYLRLSRATLGVWYNGQERLFLQKSEHDGAVHFTEIPNIPRFGERVEDIGLYRRNALQPTHNLKSVFRSIRNYLAANAVGMTRDEALAQQLMNVIFCKIYDERFTKPDAVMTVRAGFNESNKDVADRIRSMWGRVVQQYDDVFEADDKITLDDASLAYVVGELQQYALIECARDVVADAFETFIGPSLKGAQGQFFTPRNVVHLLQAIVDPDIGDRIIDPACGSGGFLVEALRAVWRKVDARGVDYGWPAEEVESEKQKVAIRNLRGIDKDAFLSKVAKAYMAILGDGRGGVYCENSLVAPSDWEAKTQQEISLGKFDVVMTNPPFGTKLKITDASLLNTYDLGHKWTLDKTTEQFKKSTKVQDGTPPQILFIERALDLLAPGGRMGVILPESLLCNPSHKHVVQYIEARAQIRAIVSMPEELFQPHTHAKTAVVYLEKHDPKKPALADYEIFMAVARWCGHDSRGLPIPHDDIPAITERYERYKAGEALEFGHLGFSIKRSEIVDSIFLPKYYNPELSQRLADLAPTHDLIVLGDLVDQGLVTVRTGHEVGKLAYGTGPIPFIRTSDIANWEIKGDPKHGVSQQIYDGLAERQNVEIGDILMVRDGTYLVGTCAIVTELDTRILFQSHLLKFKSTDPDALDPYLLLGVLSSPIVKEQIWSKRFTQDIIDTLGGRWRELVIPWPKDEAKRAEIAKAVRTVMKLRIEARTVARNAVMSVAPHSDWDETVDYDFIVLNG